MTSYLCFYDLGNKCTLHPAVFNIKRSLAPSPIAIVLSLGGSNSFSISQEYLLDLSQFHQLILLKTVFDFNWLVEIDQGILPISQLLV